MYLILKAKLFRKSYHKLKKSGIKKSILDDLKFVINTISSGGKLSNKYKDHKLQGEYKGHNECHIKGDLLLIYKIEKDKLILILVNINSHSELF